MYKSLLAYELFLTKVLLRILIFLEMGFCIFFCFTTEEDSMCSFLLLDTKGNYAVKVVLPISNYLS